MSPVHFKVGDTLRRHNKTPAALVEASGLAKTTVYNIVNNKAKAVELETLSKLMAGLRELIQVEVGITDIIEEESKPDWREELRKNAKPFYWEEVKAILPDWTEKEQAENDEFIRFLEEQRELSRQQSEVRTQRLLELFEEETEPTA